MEISSLAKRHIFHLKLNTLRKTTVYYWQRHIFMATWTGMFLLVYIILLLQGKHFFRASFSFQQFMAAFHLGGGTKELG